MSKFDECVIQVMIKLYILLIIHRWTFWIQQLSHSLPFWSICLGHMSWGKLIVHIYDISVTVYLSVNGKPISKVNTTTSAKCTTTIWTIVIAWRAYKINYHIPNESTNMALGQTMQDVYYILLNVFIIGCTCIVPL